jgi:hypothetical protein
MRRISGLLGVALLLVACGSQSGASFSQAQATFSAGLLAPTSTPPVPTSTPLPPTPAPTRTPMPPTPTIAPPTSQVMKVGNLRSEPRIAADTVVALICPEDTVALVSRAVIGDAYWYRVRIEATAADCNPKRATVGTEGWVSGVLLGEPSYAFETYADAAHLRLPTPVR